MSNNKLHKLAIKNEARKQHPVKRDYMLDLYEKYFNGLSDQPLNFLEIGIDWGGSIKMWRDYFINSNIYGLDIVKRHEDDLGPRITIWYGDQSNPIFLKNLPHPKEGYDIIIDDGGHQAKGQITSLQSLWKHLKPGGIYIVEDLHTAYWHDERWTYGHKNPNSVIEKLFKPIIDILHIPFFNKNFNFNIKFDNMSLWERAGPCQEDFTINEFEKTLESMHVYQSIIFLLKKE